MSSNRFLKNISKTLGTLGFWELGTRWWETLKLQNGYVYWKKYHTLEVIKRSDQLRQVYTIRSTGVNLHIDTYEQTVDDAPVIIFNHGAGAYCRMYIPLALKLWDRGYTVILFDQKGQGFSGGTRGDYTINECQQNIVDVSRWAKNRFKGPVYLLGMSLGGALSYYAAAAGAPVKAIATLNLFDFSPGHDALSLHKYVKSNHRPDTHHFLKTSLNYLKPLQWVRLPMHLVGDFKNMIDERDHSFQLKWANDPIPNRFITLRALSSFMQTPPRIPLGLNSIPVLVMNQQNDKMVDPAITKKNYDRLEGPKKYHEIPFGHWSNQPEFIDEIVNASDKWFKEHPGGS